MTEASVGAAIHGANVLIDSLIRFRRRRNLTRRRNTSFTIDCSGNNGGLHVKELLKSIAESIHSNESLWHGYMPGWASIYGFTVVAGDKAVPIKLSHGSFGNYNFTGFSDEHMLVGVNRQLKQYNLVRRRMFPDGAECAAKIHVSTFSSAGHLINSKAGCVKTKTSFDGLVYLEGEYVFPLEGLSFDLNTTGILKSQLIDIITSFPKVWFDRIGRTSIRLEPLDDSEFITIS